MKRKYQLVLAFAVLAASFTMVSLARDSSAPTSNSVVYQQLDRFGEVLERVRSLYVEKPEDAKLIESAINGMLTALDPHSSYLNPKQFRDMMVQTQGEFGGLGIEVTMEKGMVKVVAPLDDTPAARAGLLSGDLIIAVDKEQIQGLTQEEAVDKMRGPVNSSITLTVVRKGVDEPFQVKIIRALIHIKPVHYRAEDDVGYIRITSFNEQTTGDLQKAVESLRKEVGPKLKGYLIDLRNNPGGLLDQAASVSDAFLDRGVIVLVKGRKLEATQKADAKPGDITDGKQLVVLINGGSASGSEIVAGALRDHHRAKIVGTRSFGKGSVQTIIPLGVNGAIKLTTARYYTPAGHSIQAKGIEPDIVVEQPLPDELKKAVGNTPSEASLRGHLMAEDEEESKEVGSSSSYVPQEKDKDVQFRYGLDLLRGVKTTETDATKEADAAKALPN
jgi:carboxyl-terminal processing protease